MTGSLSVTCGPWGPAAPQTAFRREKQSLTLSSRFSSLSLFLLTHTVEYSDCMKSFPPPPLLPCLLAILFPVYLFIVLSKTSYMGFCYYCDIFAFLVAAWLLNCFLIFWHLGLLGNTDRNHCGVIMNECAVSQRRLSPPLTYFVSHARTRSSSIWLLFLYFQNAPVTVFVSVLFIHQTNHLLKLCVFPPRVVPLARCFTWWCSTNYLMHAGSPAWAAPRRTEMKSVCVRTR